MTKAARCFGAVLVGVVFAISSAHAALHYTIVTATTYKGETSYVEEDIVVDGKRARVDIKSGKKDNLRREGFMVTTDGGSTWTVVDGAKAVCGQWDLAATYRQVGSFIHKVEGWVNVKVTEASVEIVSSEPGPEILGFATTHVRIVSRLKANARIFFMKYEYHIEITDDVWFAPELQVNPVEQRWLAALAKTGYERLDGMTDAALVAIQGTVLKQKSVMSGLDVRKNRRRTKIDEMNMTAFASGESGSISADLFRMQNCKPVSDKKMEDAAKDILKSVAKPG
jgi:hypothetical protein